MLTGGEPLKGAIVFIAAFLLFLAITLGYAGLPPGRQIYDAIVGVETDYPILGIPAPTFASAILNGVIYGVIIWLVYTIAVRLMKTSKTQNVPAASSP